MISSAHNPKIQWVRKLQTQARSRREEQVFVVEGVRLAEEALEAGWQSHLVLFDQGLSERGKALVDRFRAWGTAVEEATPEVIASASDTLTPQGILAVVAQRSLPLPTEADFILIADGLRDPGNLGTLLRSAAAAGVQNVLLPPGSADIFSPKVVRSAMGAHFHLPIQSLAWEQIEALVHPSQGQRLRVFLADSAGGPAYSAVDLRQPLALIIGGEAEGASQDAIRVSDGRLHIPMPGGVESLNAAVAAAVILFEAARQRQLRS